MRSDFIMDTSVLQVLLSLLFQYNKVFVKVKSITKVIFQ